MNKAQLIDHLSDRFGGRRQAAEALDHVLDTIQRTVTAGEKVVITGFGVFEKVDRPARTARNPATGERVRVKKTSVPKFRPGSEFKSFVSGAKKLPKVAAGAAKKATAAAAGAAAGATATAKRSVASSTASKAPAKKASTAAARKKSTTTKSAAAKKSPAAKSAPAKKSSTSKTSAAKKSTTTKASAAKTTTKRAAKKA